ncbi:Meckel syndrome type 1 protein homolog [Drosophila pseudoobscura]|uniref:Meckel syndrome type 1 protein homolog n=1 Tax=Drosophila pseudoobscura pseudoobscura TaxID=46245 RepID=A0A6I8UH22_DROPS|nr:Meckel syndrome type 1 protein homolog [Drosophila pseudoobscura]
MTEKCRDTKRTGIYRLSGKITDLRLDIKLRHLSEWLPVPKLDYAGAGIYSTPSASTVVTERNFYDDCFIFVPMCDDPIFSEGFGKQIYYNYYNLGRGSTRWSSSSQRSYSTLVNARGALTHQPETETELEQDRPSEAEAEADTETESQAPQPQELNMWNEISDASRAFYALNKELCNGCTANLQIAWQQKYFSRAELETYSQDADTYTTQLQRRYHRWAQDIIELQQNHLQLEEEQQELAKEELVHVHRRIHKSKRCRSGSDTMTWFPNGGSSSASMSQVSVIEDPNFAARTCLIHTLIEADGEEHLPQEARQFHADGFQVMYVFADLQEDTLLVTIRYSPALGLVYVYPDFTCSADDMDYEVVIDRVDDCRQLYCYGFQSVTPLEAVGSEEWSLQMEGLLSGGNSEHQQSEETSVGSDEEFPVPPNASSQDLLDYFQGQRSLTTELRILSHFEMPPKRMRRVSLLLEIHEAQHFEHPNIHVRYYIQPPPHTMVETMATGSNPFPLRGATATCLGAGDSRCAHLAHCWQLTLLCEEQFDPIHLLHVYFEVISIDGWQRERCEGYAHFACSLMDPLPPSSGEGLRLQCTRPLGSWLDTLNRYFIGGRQNFDFVAYFRGRFKPESSLHTRLSLDTAKAMRNTGSLVFRIRKLQQGQPEMLVQLKMDLGPNSSEESETDRNSTLDEVIAAFVQARERIRSLLGHQASY